MTCKLVRAFAVCVLVAYWGLITLELCVKMEKPSTRLCYTQKESARLYVEPMTIAVHHACVSREELH